jgi:hypothetical protein
MEPTLVRDLDAVRRHRAELRESIAFLQAALQAAAVKPVVWGEAVQLAASRLATDFVDHIDVTEGPGGLHETIVESAPRLSHAVGLLTRDHGELQTEATALVESAEAPVMARDVDAIREQGELLIEHLIKHRQRGADLVYEAFQQDLGAGD